METRLTLFDLINVLLPGILILFFFSRCCCGSDITITVDNSYVILPFAYLVGLVYHKLLDRIFRGLRNNLILVSYCHFRESHKKMPKRVLWYSIQCNVNKNGFWRKINDVFFCLINCWCFIFSNGDKEYTQEPVGDNDLKLKETKEKYIYSYYYLQKNNMLGNVPILEAQLTFVRNMGVLFIITVISMNIVNKNNKNQYKNNVLEFDNYSISAQLTKEADTIDGVFSVVAASHSSDDLCNTSDISAGDDSFTYIVPIWLIAVLFITLPIAWLTIQHKIFHLVWEGYYYHKKLQKEDKTKNDKQ